MLHVRDCPGTTATCDVCPFPWCRKVKHLLYHLVSVENPDQCAICSPKDLPKGLQGLVGLNAHRTKKHREKLIALAKASQAAKHAKANPATKKQSTSKRAITATQANRKATSDTKVPVTQPAVQRPAPTPAPTKPKAVAASTVTAPAPAPAPAPYISTSTNVASVDTIAVSNPIVAHPAISHPATEATPGTTDDLDFVINQEIAKLDELASETGTCTIVPEAKVPFSIPDPAVEAPMPYSSIPQVSEGTYPAPDASRDQVLPTPVAAIKMDEHDADAQELRNLLATNSSEDHTPVQPVDDLADISEYLKNDDDQLQRNGNIPVTEHQHQIDMDSGVPGALNDPNSDPLANMNHEIVYESSDYVPEYTETSTSEATPDVSTVKAEATSVEKPVGPVAVN